MGAQQRIITNWLPYYRGNNIVFIKKWGHPITVPPYIIGTTETRMYPEDGVKVSRPTHLSIHQLGVLYICWCRSQTRLYCSCNNTTESRISVMSFRLSNPSFLYTNYPDVPTMQGETLRRGDHWHLPTRNIVTIITLPKYRKYIYHFTQNTI